MPQSFRQEISALNLNLEGLLEQLGLSDHLPAFTGASTVDSLAESLAFDRPAFLMELKRLGLTLPQRQTLANHLGRWTKELPLVLRVDCGLCNRLRALCSYHAIASERGQQMLVVWTPSEECPGHFSEYFQDLPGVRLVESLTAQVVRPAQLRLGRAANDFHPDIKHTPDKAAACLGQLSMKAALEAAVGQSVER